MTYRLAPGVRLVGAAHGPALLSKRPLRLVRVSGALAGLLTEGTFASSSGEARAVLGRLADKGLLQKLPPEPFRDDELPAVTVVIPVKDRAEELRRCLGSLEALDYPREKLEVLVVDDGSSDAGREIAAAAGARVVPSGGVGLGPAAARNRGAAVARGELLAFLDSDCTASAGWLRELAEGFRDADVAAVGGRVEGMHGATALDRYEAEMSSLCLGPRERTGGEGDDTFYLPSCNLLVRRREFLGAGGFREDLRVGEDVDLTWRLRDGGGRILYTPRGPVRHEHRNRPGGFLRRRFEYGTSEGLLGTLHPARRKKMAAPPALVASSLLAATSLLAGRWTPLLLGGLVLLADTVRLGRSFARSGVELTAAELAAARMRAWGSFVYYASFHLVRYHAAPLLAATLVWPRFGLLAAALALWAGAVDHRVRRPRLGFVPFLFWYLAEHVAYGTGVLWGSARRGSFGNYRITLAKP